MPALIRDNVIIIIAGEEGRGRSMFVTSTATIVTPSSTGEGSIWMSVSVCPQSYLRNYTSKFLFILPMDVARSSSSSVVICYVTYFRFYR